MTNFQQLKLPIQVEVAEHGDVYYRIPLDAYQLGNLLGLLKRTKEHANGDWFWELVSMVSKTMEECGIEQLNNNFGDTFTKEQVLKGEIWAIR